jgi:hypothetical protein
MGMSGAIAQYGRGMIQDVSSRLVSSFADCLQKQLTAEPEAAQAAVAAQSQPVGGLRLGFGALGRAIGRIFHSKERSDS